MSALPQPAEAFPPPPERARDAGAAWATRAVLGVIATLNAIGGLLMWRRLAGALTENLPMAPLFATALAATIAAKLSRIAWRQTRPRPIEFRERLVDQAVGWGSSLGLALLAFGCCYPGYRNGEWLIWLPMLVADQFWRQGFFDGDRPGIALADLPVDEYPEPVSESAENDANEDADDPSEQIVQQLYRVRDVDGYEVIYGTVRAEFLAGQRNATVHVGFCPPLASLPQVEAEPCNWPEARVKVVQALAHGVRLDVRLSEPAEEACSVPIDLAATPTSEA